MAGFNEAVQLLSLAALEREQLQQVVLDSVRVGDRRRAQAARDRLAFLDRVAVELHQRIVGFLNTRFWAVPA